MKWIVIAESWRNSAPTIETDVRSTVHDVIERGDGIVSGGALGVDYFALDEALKLDQTGKQIKIFIPSTLEVFSTHYRKRAEEGVITQNQAETLINQLVTLKNLNKNSLVQGDDAILDKTSYFNRITMIIEAADEIVTFSVNASEGTQDTINKAKNKGIPVKVFNYTVAVE